MTAILPSRLYTAAQTRELDRQAIAAGTPGEVLMERAGNKAFSVLRRRWPEARRIAVLCGGGNNGGDGYVVARLARQAGLSPTIHFIKPPESLSGDALTMAQRCQALDVPMQALTPDTLPEEADLLVDSLLGTGLSGALREPLPALLGKLNALKLPVLAVDIPSGLSADTGRSLGEVLSATVTVTFIGTKRGLLTGEGPVQCSELEFFSLRVPASVYEAVPADCWRPVPGDLAQTLPARRADGHKGRYGHVLVLGGDHGYAGAPVMTAQAAARCGAGLVTLATRADQVNVALARQPELMVRGAEDASDLAPLLEKATVVAVGPGLGQQAWGRALLEAALRSGKPLVIDTDGLNLFAAMEGAGPADWVLTPHPGEAARLLQCGTAEVQNDRFAAVADLQARFGGAVLLKGAGTLVAGESGRALVSDGNPGMASGGMGDVLTGVIAALRAQGLDGFQAAALGAMVHGRAADQAAARDGQRGLLATDLLPELRKQVNGRDSDH